MEARYIQVETLGPTWEARYIQENITASRQGSLLTQRSKCWLHGHVQRMGEKVCRMLVNERHLINDPRNN